MRSFETSPLMQVDAVRMHGERNSRRSAGDDRGLVDRRRPSDLGGLSWLRPAQARRAPPAGAGGADPTFLEHLQHRGVLRQHLRDQLRKPGCPGNRGEMEMASRHRYALVRSTTAKATSALPGCTTTRRPPAMITGRPSSSSTATKATWLTTRTLRKNAISRSLKSRFAPKNGGRGTGRWRGRPRDEPFAIVRFQRTNFDPASIARGSTAEYSVLTWPATSRRCFG